MSSAAEGIGPKEIAEGVSEDIEDMVDDEGDTSASGVDEDEAELADGQEINAGGPDPVLDENEEIVSKIIPGTAESADAKPWNPEHDPARPEGVTTESEILEESDSESDTTPGDTADIDAEEVAEGIAEDAEDAADDDGAATAEGVDEAEEVLADGQMTNAGGPDAVVDEYEEIDAKIIPGTGESADAKPWDPEDDPARPEGVTTESEILEESDSDSDTDPGDTADVDAADIEEGIAEEAEDAEVDDGPTGADGVDEDEGALADGQMDNAGGPDPVADDDYVERDKKIIPGTGESADAKPWKPKG